MSSLHRGAGKLRNLFRYDSLFRNASYLMASTGIMSLLGFGFWLFVAHLYSPSDIGIASALISITLLISNLSLLGLNAGLIRFLPESKNQSRDINAAILTVGGAAMAASLIYLLVERFVGGNHNAFIAHPWSWPLFMVLMAAVALNTLTDAVFIANRRAEYHTIVYTSFGVVKLILPLFLIPFASMGIFTAYIASVIVSLGLSLYLMARRCRYIISARPNWQIISKTRKYAASNYTGVVLAGIPSQVLPSFIIAVLGSSEAAYFALSWTMANLLYVIPSSITQSLLAESSHNPAKQTTNLKNAVRILATTLIPTVIVAALVAPYLLRVFGLQYAQGSSAIFQIMAVSTLFIAINSVASTVLNIQHRSFGIVRAQIALVVVTMAGSALLIRFGLVGIGLAMLLGYIASNLVYATIFMGDRLKHRRAKAASAKQNFGRALKLERLLAYYDISDFKATPLTEQSFNQTYLIVSRGRRSILRVYDPNLRTHSEIEREIGFVQALRTSSVPVPSLIDNRRGETISSIESNGKPLHFVLMEYIDGTHLMSPTPELIGDMAHQQAVIHNHGYSYAKSTQAKLDPHVMSLKQRLVRWMTLLALTPQGLSHFDYDPTNILVHDGHLAAILDFEGLRYDSLLICLLFTLSQLSELGVDSELMTSYLNHYQEVRPLGRLERILLRWGLTLRLRSLHYLRLSYR
jgi:O-antigen/teichoic acid export membrane protein/Ser/Thr protein kinase RdoA (MazF antagonist)